MAVQGTDQMLWEFFISLLVYICVILKSITALSSFVPSWIYFQGTFQQTGKALVMNCYCHPQGNSLEIYSNRDPTCFTDRFSSMWWFALVWITVFCCFCLFLVVQCVVRKLLGLSRIATIFL